MRLLVFFLMIFSMNAFSVKEENLKEIWATSIHPFYDSLERGSFKNSQGLEISYRYYLKSKDLPSLVVLPGQAEPAMKYAEVLYDLKNTHHNLFIIDHQGQGESDRLLADSQKSHVRYFQDYVNDLKQFVDEVVRVKVPENELRLLAHSMGGAIAVMYLSQYKDDFKRAILNAPMFQINTKPYPDAVAYGLAGFLVKIGRGDKYAPGRGPYLPENDRFDTNPFTNSEVRHSVTRDMNIRWAELVVGGPTSRWVFQSLKATKTFTSLAPKIEIPILIFQAGKDSIVKNPKQDIFCKKAPHCKLKALKDSKHEILMEKDQDRNQVLIGIRTFLE